MFFKNKGINLEYKEVILLAEEHENIENIEIEEFINPILIYQSEDDTFKFSYYESENQKYEFSIEDDTFILKNKGLENMSLSGKSFAIGKMKVVMNYSAERNRTGDLTLYLPQKEYNLFLENVEGNIDVVLSEIGELDIETVNGCVELTVDEADEVNVETVNGNIDIFKLTEANEVNCELVNGTANIKNICAEELTIETVNGGINLQLQGNEKDYNIKKSTLMHEEKIDNHAYREVSLKSVTGKIKIEYIE